MKTKKPVAKAKRRTKDSVRSIGRRRAETAGAQEYTAPVANLVPGTYEYYLAQLSSDPANALAQLFKHWDERIASDLELAHMKTFQAKNFWISYVGNEAMPFLLAMLARSGTSMESIELVETSIVHALSELAGEYDDDPEGYRHRQRLCRLALARLRGNEEHELYSAMENYHRAHRCLHEHERHIGHRCSSFDELRRARVSGSDFLTQYVAEPLRSGKTFATLSNEDILTIARDLYHRPKSQVRHVVAYAAMVAGALGATKVPQTKRTGRIKTRFEEEVERLNEVFAKRLKGRKK